MMQTVASDKRKRGKTSAAYAEHLLDLFGEILHRTITIRPLDGLPVKVTPSLAQTMQYLHQHGVCSVREIARGLTITYSAASQLTDRLVRRGLASRSENQTDRRISEIRLTDGGVRLVERIRLSRIEGLSRILRAMKTDDRAAFIGHLESFIRSAIEDAHGALESCSHCGSDHLPECVVNEVYRTATGKQINEI
ncbi:MAG: MarR family transcriptional regulator [Armatimonadetes bacterium]|nr:MarR family transcriptional regulator [Armatimonadota bacterium]